MADCCFSAERRPVDAGMTSQLARFHVVPLRPGKGAADRRRSSSSPTQAGPATFEADALPGRAAVTRLDPRPAEAMIGSQANANPWRRLRLGQRSCGT